jgi:ATP-dependent RNA helicase DDX24/MAK5
LKFLVLDEADRMIETGHFAELDNILRLTLCDSRFVYIITFVTNCVLNEMTREDDEMDSESGVKPDKNSKGETASALQTFVFSATLSKDLQRNVKRSSRVKHKKNTKASSTLGDPNQSLLYLSGTN